MSIDSLIDPAFVKIIGFDLDANVLHLEVKSDPNSCLLEEYDLPVGEILEDIKKKCPCLQHQNIVQKRCVGLYIDSKVFVSTPIHCTVDSIFVGNSIMPNRARAKLLEKLCEHEIISESAFNEYDGYSPLQCYNEEFECDCDSAKQWYVDLDSNSGRFNPRKLCVKCVPDYVNDDDILENSKQYLRMFTNN
jgi:hypothetical protein